MANRTVKLIFSANTLPYQAICLAVLCCFMAVAAYSQNPTGAIFGIVTDPSGGSLAGVQIIARNINTGLDRRVKTSDAGEFRIPILPIGTYEVTATLVGFKTAVRSDLQLAVQQTLRADIGLEVGEVKESVQVTGQAPQLEPESSASGHVIQNKQIENLPLNVRQFMQLAYLVPFATPATRDFRTGETNRGTPVPAGAGQRPEQNNYQIDGLDNKESGRNNFSVTPPIDSISEFKVQTGMAPAEFGRGGGVIINLVTRGGSNSFHGSAYEFLRNNALDARPFFSSRVNPLKRNQFGASLGGPLRHDKLFFFGNYEGFRESATGNPAVGLVPTDDLRNGTFATRIVDPLACSDPLNKATCLEFPRVGNNWVIPANRISPTSSKIMTLWPSPNNSDPARNFIFNAVPPALDTRDFAVGRVDYILGPSDTIYGRYLYDNEALNSGQTLPIGIGGRIRNLRAQTAGGHYVRVVSPRTINDFSYGFMRYSNVNATYFSNVKNYITDFGITNTLSETNPLFWGTPGVSIPGYLSTDSGNPNLRASNIHQVQDGISWNRGAHLIKAGADFRLVDTDMLYTGGNGAWGFTNAYSLNNFADFLLAMPSTASKVTRIPHTSGRVKYFSGYIQDDIKIGRRLTLNLGLRYEVESIPDQASHAVPGFDPTTGEVLISDKIDIKAEVVSFYKNIRPDVKYRFVPEGTPINADTNNFVPRAGFAFQAAKNTVIRGGFGMFVDSPQTVSYYLTNGNNFAPNILTPGWVSNPSTPELFSYNPEGNATGEATFKTALLSLQPWLAGKAGSNGVIDYSNGRDFPYGMIRQWMFSVQHQITPSLLVEVQYLGSHSTNLIGNDNIQITSPGPGALPARLPYVGYSRVENTSAWHRAWYNGAGLKVEQRLRKGLSYLVSYTYSKSLDDSSTLNADPFWTDPANKFNGKGPSDFDVRNRFVASFQYEVPIGRGRAVGGHWSRPADALLGGWGVRGIASFQTGFLYSPGMTLSRVGYCLASCAARPERIANGNLSKDQRTINRYFDTTAFRLPPAFTLGSASGRNVLYGPGVNNWDLGIYKEFRIKEGHSLEFRYEAFNAFNHTQYSAPAVNFEAPATFGTISGTSAPRISQVALRYAF